MKKVSYMQKSLKISQKNRERLQKINSHERYQDVSGKKLRKSENMVKNNIKISQETKKYRFSINKDNIKYRKNTFVNKD